MNLRYLHCCCEAPSLVGSRNGGCDFSLAHLKSSRKRHFRLNLFVPQNWRSCRVNFNNFTYFVPPVEVRVGGLEVLMKTPIWYVNMPLWLKVFTTSPNARARTQLCRPFLISWGIQISVEFVCSVTSWPLIFASVDTFFSADMSLLLFEIIQLISWIGDIFGTGQWHRCRSRTFDSCNNACLFAYRHDDT